MNKLDVVLRKMIIIIRNNNHNFYVCSCSLYHSRSLSSQLHAIHFDVIMLAAYIQHQQQQHEPKQKDWKEEHGKMQHIIIIMAKICWSFFEWQCENNNVTIKTFLLKKNWCELREDINGNTSSSYDLWTVSYKQPEQ